VTVDDLRVPAPVAQPVEVAARRHPRGAVVGLGLVVAVGLVARFVTVSPMWLDEALSVNIARLPAADLFEALRHDGAPPLYYLFLHGWMDVLGTGDVAARALSGLFSAAALPLMWLAGRRLAERMPSPAPTTSSPLGLPAAAVVLLASSPFAIRYATEARMYSLVVLLVLAGFLALDTLLHRRSRPAGLVLGLVTGLLLLTHYWAFFLVAATSGLLAGRWWRAAGDGLADDGRAGARRGLLAMAAGSLLFLPWLPSFLEQMRTTGTPWGRSPPPRAFFDVVFGFSSGYPETGLPLGLLLYALVGLGLFGTAAAARSIVILDLRGRPPGRMLAATAALTMVLAIVVGKVTGSAYAVRYAAVVFPLVLLLAALGSATLSGSRAGPVVLGLAAVLGFTSAIPSLAADRTSAARVAAVLRAEARPGDVVAYCPDQLGPAVDRLLEGSAPDLVQVTFPRAGRPELVDWVGYEEANEAARTAPFARMLLDRAGPERAVWVVWAPNYRTYDTKCQALLDDLRQARPQERRVVKVSTNTFERPGLVQYPPE
jgi:mannosyltransferase